MTQLGKAVNIIGQGGHWEGVVRPRDVDYLHSGVIPTGHQRIRPVTYVVYGDVKCSVQLGKAADIIGQGGHWERVGWPCDIHNLNAVMNNHNRVRPVAYVVHCGAAGPRRATRVEHGWRVEYGKRIGRVCDVDYLHTGINGRECVRPARYVVDGYVGYPIYGTLVVHEKGIGWMRDIHDLHASHNGHCRIRPVAYVAYGDILSSIPGMYVGHLCGAGGVRYVDDVYVTAVTTATNLAEILEIGGHESISPVTYVVNGNIFYRAMRVKAAGMVGYS